MKQYEIEDAIGKSVTVNGSGDLGMDREMRRLIYSKVVLTLEKQCKSGLLYLRENKKLAHAVPMTNVDLYYPVGDTVLHETPVRPAFNHLANIRALSIGPRSAFGHKEVSAMLREENFKRVLQQFLDGFDIILREGLNDREYSMPLEFLQKAHFIDTRAEAERLAAAINFSGQARAEVKTVNLAEVGEVLSDQLETIIIEKADRKVHYNSAEEVLFEMAESAKEKK